MIWDYLQSSMEEFQKKDTPDKLKMFISHVLHKNYSELNVFEKHTAHQMFADLMNRCNHFSEENNSKSE